MNRLTQPQGGRGDYLASTEELIDEMVATVRTGNRPAERADCAQRAVNPRIRKVIDLMRENVSREICFDDLAAEAGMSRPHLFALFKERPTSGPTSLGTSSGERSVRMLHQDGHKMYALAADLGFTDEGRSRGSSAATSGYPHSSIAPPSPAWALPSWTPTRWSSGRRAPCDGFVRSSWRSTG